MNAGISIVIPAFNPQPRIFARVLRAVAALERPAGIEVDCTIVDNRSDPPLSEAAYIREFMEQQGRATLVREERQGLTYARLRGFRSTTEALVVVFDDDNEPEPGYLKAALACAREWPSVGVWGPGTVDVELLDVVPRAWETRVRETHNERHEQHVQYGSVPASWQPYYPIGMGQVIRREVADAYANAVDSGELSATDRSGGSLASGGDIQIVWQAVRAGMAAGIHPALAMRHLIPGSRASAAYLKRLAFGCGLSYHPAMAQSFPSPRSAPTAVDPRLVVHMARFVARRVVRGRTRFLSIDFANQLGLICGSLIAGGHGSDGWPFRLARRLRLT